MKIEVGENDYFDYYYGLIDFEFFARKNLGEEVVAWMKKNIHPLDIVFRLAQDHGIVLLNGSGFAAPDWSVRISFANLEDHVYDDIGRALRAIARGYLEQYRRKPARPASQGRWRTSRRTRQAGAAQVANGRANHQGDPSRAFATALRAAANRGNARSQLDQVMNYVLDSLRQHPELAIFLTLAAGFVIGRIKIGSFKLGNVVGTLIAGVLIGQLNIKIEPTVKAVFFSLFLFATGYKVGPQFFRGLRKSAMSQVVLTVVFCVTSLITTLVAARIMGYDTGTAAGLMAGAFTESTVIGTASDTIDRLDLPEAEKTRLKNNIPVAYAVSYLVGTGFVVWFLSVAAPRLLRINLKEESAKLAAVMQQGGGEGPSQMAYKEWTIRAYRLANIPGGQTVADLEGIASNERVFVERIRRGAELIDATPTTVLQSGDVVAIGGASTSAGRRQPAARRGSRGPDAARLPDGHARHRRDEAGCRRATAVSRGRAARARRRAGEVDPRRRRDSVRR